jgi:hypothetical protein
MIVLTAEELDSLAEIVLKKIDRDKRFDRYTDCEIVTILGMCIMQIGANVAESYKEMEETSDEDLAS